ncbi:MAG: hypothetical protein NZ703_03135 [Gemmataceae bacterium]|nr:hypothetical protein [Gemmataceae bacterium]
MALAAEGQCQGVGKVFGLGVGAMGVVAWSITGGVCCGWRMGRVGSGGGWFDRTSGVQSGTEVA